MKVAFRESNTVKENVMT